MAKVQVVPYGCNANRDDAALAAGLLHEAGHDVSVDEEPDDTGRYDVIILLTCVVRDRIDAKMVNLMMSIETPLVVAGCFPEAYPDRVRKIRPDVPMVGPRYLDRLPEAVAAALKGERVEFIGLDRDPTWKVDAPRIESGRSVVVTISEGCPNRCAYCAVKLARGDLSSFPPQKVLRRVEGALQREVLEIVLTSQDTATYGLDIGTNIVELLEDVANICEGEDVRVRVGMFNPGHAHPFIDELADVLATWDDVFYRTVHMPIQSGDDEVLKRMNRPYDREIIEEDYRVLSRKLGYFNFVTDVIIGFPGETEEAFRNTLELLEWMRPHILHASRYCRRPRTPAAEMKDQVPEEVKLERSRLLHHLRLKWAREANRELIGKEVEVLRLGDDWGRDEHAKKTLFEDSPPEDVFEGEVVDASHSYLLVKA